MLYLLDVPCSPGVHLEGPFISQEKKGAHPEQFLRTFRGSGGMGRLLEVYGGLDNVSMVTLAPELDGSQSVVEELSQRGITVSLGGSAGPGVRGHPDQGSGVIKEYISDQLQTACAPHK